MKIVANGSECVFKDDGTAFEWRREHDSESYLLVTLHERGGAEVSFDLHGRHLKRFVRDGLAQLHRDAAGVERGLLRSALGALGLLVEDEGEPF